jgi:CubicO group peptidase (beta-lactamase class C family)
MSAGRLLLTGTAGIAVALAAACDSGGDVRPAPTASPDGRVAASVATLTAAAFADKPGCSAAVGVEGRVVWAGARGLADVAADEPLSPATVFDIASVSKQFTATAVLLLAADGRLTVGDPLAKHLDGLPGWLGRVTLSQLLHHTSGLPEYGELLIGQGHALTDRTTHAQAVRALTGAKAPRFAPGARFEYANSNYVLLAEVVHAASGSPLPEFLADRVFGPLGLAMTLDPTGAVKGRALSYERDAPLAWAWQQIGDGAVLTTPTELVRWADNYRTGRLGGRDLLTAQLADPVDVDPRARYAAGIVAHPNGGLSHNGSWAGYRSAFRISPDRRTAVAVACNAAELTPELVAEQLEKIWS